jgi:hypothetical protein
VMALGAVGWTGDWLACRWVVDVVCMVHACGVAVDLSRGLPTVYALGVWVKVRAFHTPTWCWQGALSCCHRRWVAAALRRSLLPRLPAVAHRTCLAAQSSLPA